MTAERNLLQPTQIDMPRDCFRIMIEHCRRKLSRIYLPDEDSDLKAFGLLAGQKTRGTILASRCFPLLRNARQDNEYRDYMDRMMAEHAIPSETPFTDRGWVVAPGELSKALQICREQNLLIIGSYHMHRVAWRDDPIRDTPTVIDSILGNNSRLVMFIISMVHPAAPILRAFHEGDVNREIPIHYIDG